MFSRIFVTCLVFVSLSLTALAAWDDAMISTVMKVKTYERNSIDGNYVFSHYGSAVLIDSKRIITNAHVILDSDNKSPTGYYEICKSEKDKKVPTCFTTARLISYDTIADLAVLELATPINWAKGVTFADKKELPVASSVIVYGYPSIGGKSITRTEGKIGGVSDMTYKFDGTIDHGNSGGGAFSADGKLIGMPYAVKSDNGTIGYIIPISRIIDFLAGKTDNIEKYTTKINSTFSPYIKNIELLYKNPNLIKTKYVEIKNADKNGFTLSSAITSTTGDIFMYYFLDKNNRVSINVTCSKDSSITWTSYSQYIQDYVKSQQDDKSAKTLTTGSFLDSSKNIYLAESIDIKETKWEKWILARIVMNNAPTCGITVMAQDGKNKDRTSYERALWFAKTIKYTNTQGIQESFNSPFFSVKKLTKDVYLSQDFSNTSIIPFIGMIFSSRAMVSSSFDLLKFDDVDGYMNYGYVDNKQYTGKGYTFDDFFNRYRTTGYDNVLDEKITTKDGKKLIMNTKNFTDRMASPEKFEKLITFFYPFVTAEGEYRAYKFEFTVKTEEMDVQLIRQFIETLEFPWKSPFKD